MVLLSYFQGQNSGIELQETLKTNEQGRKLDVFEPTLDCGRTMETVFECSKIDLRCIIQRPS